MYVEHARTKCTLHIRKHSRCVCVCVCILYRHRNCTQLATECDKSIHVVNFNVILFFRFHFFWSSHFYSWLHSISILPVGISGMGITTRRYQRIVFKRVWLCNIVVCIICIAYLHFYFHFSAKVQGESAFLQSAMHIFTLLLRFMVFFYYHSRMLST